MSDPMTVFSLITRPQIATSSIIEDTEINNGGHSPCPLFYSSLFCHSIMTSLRGNTPRHTSTTRKAKEREPGNEIAGTCDLTTQNVKLGCVVAYESLDHIGPNFGLISIR